MNDGNVHGTRLTVYRPSTWKLSPLSPGLVTRMYSRPAAAAPISSRIGYTRVPRVLYASSRSVVSSSRSSDRLTAGSEPSSTSSVNRAGPAASSTTPPSTTSPSTPCGSSCHGASLRLKNQVRVASGAPRVTRTGGRPSWSTLTANLAWWSRAGYS